LYLEAESQDMIKLAAFLQRPICVVTAVE